MEIFIRVYVISGVIGFAIAAALLLWLQFAPAQAAPLPPVSIVMCGKIATTGPIDFYFCETDFGNFFVNSLGFMVLEE